MSALTVRAAVRRRGVDVDFTVDAGRVLALLGPNGAGKSTVLHVIAGLIRPDAGTVRLGERVLTDVAAGVGVAPHDRRIGLLLQGGLLFPHLSVAANVAFGPRSRRSGRRAAAASATRWLDAVGAGQLAGRSVRELSGGQAQRVALARALAAEPLALLLDEPFAGLDVAVASAMRSVLRDVLTRDGRSAVLVTHDLLDVVTLADDVLVLEPGGTAEYGPTAAVLAAPRSVFAARLAGVNMVSGRADGPGLRTGWGQQWHGEHAQPLTDGTPAAATFTPAAVAVHRRVPAGSPRNVVAVVVAELDARGTAVRVRADPQPDGAPGLAADITAEAAAELRLAPGEEVFFVVKAQSVTVHPAPPPRG